VRVTALEGEKASEADGGRQQDAGAVAPPPAPRALPRFLDEGLDGRRVAGGRAGRSVDAQETCPDMKLI
jgi:hypothetical protein